MTRTHPRPHGAVPLPLVRLAVPRRTLADVRARRPAIVTYSVHTCWWNDDWPPCRSSVTSMLPLDPRGSPCMQTDDVEGFLAAAERNAARYGRHGLVAFELALHGNIIAPDGAPTCLTAWADYNALLDRAGAVPR